MADPNIEDATWSDVSANNTTAVPAGIPAGSAPSAVYTMFRATLMAAMKKWFARAHTTISSTGSANAYLLAYTASATTLAYVHGQRFSFKASFANTGSATAAVDALAAKTIQKQTSAGMANLASGDIQTNQHCILEYDSALDKLILLNPQAGSSLATPVSVANGGTGQTGANAAFNALAAAGGTLAGGVYSMSSRAFNEAKGAAVASANSCDIWTPGDGNYVHITGTTTINNFATAPQAGARRIIIFDGACQLTNGANLAVPGGANYTTAAGDCFQVIADTTTAFKLVAYSLASGKSIIAPASSAFTNFVLLTSGTTWNVPAGVTEVLVTVQGGGGSGGGALNASSQAAGGGSAGASITALVAVTGGGTVSYAIGAGGAAPSAGNNAGNPGGDTNFGTIIAKGGPGGTRGSTHAASALAAGPGLVPSSGTSIIAGVYGALVQGADQVDSTHSGAGGTSLFGAGGTSVAASSAGVAGSIYGGGGSGAADNGTANRAGGAGAAGCIALFY